MAGIEREASVTWRGDLGGGSGRLTTSSDLARDADLSWPGRVAERQAGPTSPEELIAAAHAGCYSMSLSNVLGEGGTPPEQLDVRARCIAEDAAGGLRIVAVELIARAAVPGLDAAAFAALAREAERRCPVSNAVRGNLEIRLDATLV